MSKTAQLKPSIYKFEGGFSLIEALVIIILVGFIIIIISSLSPFINLIGTSRFESVAKDIAQKQVEDLRALPYNSLSNTGSPSPTIPDARLSKLPQSSGTYIIEDCDSQVCLNGERLKKVTIKVEWKEQTKDKKVEVVSFIAEGGLK